MIGAGRRQHSQSRLAELRCPVRLLAWIGTTGTPSRFASRGDINRQAFALRRRRPCSERQHHRHAQLQDLAHQVQVAFQVAASTMHTTTSSRVHRRSRPSSTSTGTISSGERGARL